jgi:aconitate hydratase
MIDTITNQNGEEVMFDEPTGWELPPNGFDVLDNGYLAPEADGGHVKVTVKEDSERLQLLTPFIPIGNKIEGAKLLIKAHGKCTTDHISMAGPWLRYRGHLDNISNNCLIGAVNAFNMKTNFVKSQLNGDYDAVQKHKELIKMPEYIPLLLAIIIMERALLESTLLWNPVI